MCVIGAASHCRRNPLDSTRRSTRLRSYNSNMTERDSKETRSYRDPMAPRVETAKLRREAEAAAYPEVVAAYDGFYLRVEELTEEGNRYILGAEGIIGSELFYDASQGALVADDGRSLALLPSASAERLSAHAFEGWSIKPLVSTTFFRAQDKSAAVDVAFICWAPTEEDFDVSLTTFCHNIADRLANGDRADVVLTQDQFVSVLRSKGAWYLTPATKREPTEKGTVVYKARRSGTERLIGYALKHRSGCNILAILFFVLVGAGIIFLIWNAFFR